MSDQYVIVVVSTQDMEGNDRLKVIGPFPSEADAKAQELEVSRAYKRHYIMRLEPPTGEVMRDTDTTETGPESFGRREGRSTLYRRLISWHTGGWAMVDNGGGTFRLYPVVAPDTGALHLIPWDELEKLQDAGLVAGADAR